MPLFENNEQMDYIVREVMNRLSELLRTSLMILFTALAVLIFSVIYLLKPLYQFQSTTPVSAVCSCPGVETTLLKKESRKTIAPSILKDSDLDNKSRKITNAGIKFNSNVMYKQAEKVAASKDSYQGPSEYNIDEDIIRDIGLQECFKLPERDPKVNV